MVKWEDVEDKLKNRDISENAIPKDIMEEMIQLANDDEIVEKKEEFEETKKTSKQILDQLFYNGKQCSNIEITHAWIDGEGEKQCFGKWKDYAELDLWEIEKAQHRTILKSEIVLDIDTKTKEEATTQYKKIIKELKKEKYSFKGYFTGSKGYHIHLLFDGLLKFEGRELKEIKEYFIRKYDCDAQKSINRCMIALEGADHWKTGNKKTLLDVEENGKNDISPIVEDCEEKKKTKKIYDEIIQPNNIEELKEECLTLLALKNRSEATELIVQYIEEKTTLKTTRNDEKSEIWIYQEGIYVSEGKCYIQEITRGILGKTYTTQIVNQIISKIEADTYIDQEKFFNEQNKYPELIAVKNGILNIKTKELTDFTKEIPFFNKLSMPYIPEIKCENFLGFLNDIVEKKEDAKCIQELFGFSMLKKYKYKKSFMFYGGGDNGKTQLLKILNEKFIGLDNSQELSLVDIEKDNYLLSELQNKLVNISADISNEALNNSGKFKNLCGGDMISCNRKYKTPVKLLNYAKLIFACNELPIPKDDSSGFWGRWILLNFPYKFLKQTEINTLPDGEREKVKLAIPDIVEKIINEKELCGILNWALEGFARLEKQKGFTNNETREQVKTEWLKSANSVLAFISENIEEEYDSYIIKNDFRQAYLRYCKEHKLVIKSEKIIKDTLEKELSAYSEQKNILDQRIRVWCGIKFKEKNTQHSQNTQIETLGEKKISQVESKHHVLPVLAVLNKKGLDENSFFTTWKKENKLKSLQDFLDLGFTEKQIDKWKEEGKIFKPKPDGYMVI